jgi:tetratricopeptide (TPR) repeat protein
VVAPGRAGWWAAAAVAAVCLATLPRSARSAAPPAGDYDRDLARLEGLLPHASGERRPLLLAERAALTAQPEHARLAQAALDEALARPDAPAELLLARVDLALRGHRLPQAERDLETLDGRVPPGVIRARRADLALQRGRYPEARAALEEELRRSRGWETLARLAHLESLHGADAAADGLYAQAADELTAKQMRALAWVEVQRGALDLGRGRLSEARGHYERARRAYSGYWLVEERLAELAAAEGRFQEALALYERLAELSPRPELQQAVGDLHLHLGQPARAAPWHQRALAAYLDSAGRGEVQYLHHLASFYADVRGDAAQALAWARRDLELRASVPALDGFAWALYRAGRFGEASAAMARARQPGLEDAHLLSRAGLIEIAAGRTEAGRALLARAAAQNPGYAAFHAHH